MRNIYCTCGKEMRQTEEIKALPDSRGILTWFQCDDCEYPAREFSGVWVLL